MPTAVAFQRTYNTILKIYAPDKSLKLSKLGQKKKQSPFKRPVLFLLTLPTADIRTFKNRHPQLGLIFVMIHKSSSDTAPGQLLNLRFLNKQEVHPNRLEINQSHKYLPPKYMTLSFLPDPFGLTVTFFLP